MSDKKIPGAEGYLRESPFCEKPTVYQYPISNNQISPEVSQKILHHPLLNNPKRTQ
jgi:hypothetical protein